jgi:hypothetical protein
MKYIIIIVSFLFLSCSKSLYTKPVGMDFKVTLLNKKEIHHMITADTMQLKSQWNKALKENEIIAEVSHFRIKTGIDEMTEKKYYYLIADTFDGKLKMTTKLVKHKKKYYLDVLEPIYFICYGSPTCNPVRFNNNWEYDSRDLMNCRKTEVVFY